MFAAPVRGIRIYPTEWENWICLRAELYGFYLGSEMCASSDPVDATSSSCVGDRNCGQNAECTTVPSQGTYMKTTTTTTTILVCIPFYILALQKTKNKIKMNKG